MPFIDDIGDLLDTGGIGTRGTDLFTGLMPSSPDAAVVVIEQAGTAPEHVMSGGAGGAILEHLQFQCLIRSTTYTLAEAKARSIFDLLDHLSDRAINGNTYLLFKAIQSPFAIEEDDNQRPRFSINFSVEK